MRLTNEFLNALSVPAFAIDLRHVVVGWNRPCEALTGIAAADVMGTPDHWKGFYDGQRPCLADLVLDNLTADASRFYDQHEKAEFASDGHKAEGWFDDMNGKRRFLTFEAKPMFSGGELIGALEILQDITRHREAEEQLQLSASVFENTSEGIMITDATNRIISANKALEALTGFSQAELLGQNPKIFTSDRHPGTFFKKMWEMLRELGHWQGEIWNRKKTGEEYLVRAYISAVKTGQTTTNYIGLLSDITEISRAMEKMDHLAHHDFLTGLPNRSLLEDRLQQALVRANRNNSRFAVMFMDLDRFKNINDTLGHDIGDLLLKAVTRRIQGCLRASDTVSRQGGDEFVLLLEDFSEDADITHNARKLLEAIGRPCTLGEHTLSVTSSIGISLYPDDGDTAADLLKHADTAMYHAKAQGRNNFQFFTESINARALETLMVENGLKRAIPEELELHYQPQLCLVSQSVHGAEALVRWAHPQLGLISPARFIPIAEDSGLICELGEWVLREACRIMRDTGINMSVNLSPMQLGQRNLVAQVAEALDGMAGHRLTLEITESAFIHDFAKTKEVLLALKRIGVNLSLDDFGTGYSSLSYLYQLPFDYIKIDQSFIRDDRNKPIVLAVLEMANKLSLMTVAEGVETPEQMAFLEASSCDVVQGFYFSKPLPLDELRAFAADPPYQVSAKPLLKPAPALGGSLLNWSFTFESGHPGIDAQHKQLINILNQLDATARSGNRLAEARHTMKALIEYVKEHFSYEEMLMRRHGYPESDRHQAEHIGFAEKLTSYDLQLKGNPQFNPNHLLSFVRNWLINHILKTDKRLGGFLRKNGASNVAGAVNSADAASGAGGKMTNR